MDGGELVASFFVGTIGFALAVYGKKQSRLPHLLAGILLMAFPYFVGAVWLIALITVLILALLVVLTRMGL